MIVSHKCSFIFLHSRRTAGNSFAAHFAKYAGPDDFIMESWIEILSHGGRYNRRAIRDALRTGIALALYSPRRIVSVFRKVGRQRPVAGIVTELNLERVRASDLLGPSPPHASAAQVARLFPREWESYYRFAFVRNPFEFAVSDYLCKQPASIRQRVSFVEYLRRMADPEEPDPEYIVPVPRNNFGIYTIDGQIAVDFLGRYENLAQDMEKVCKVVGLPYNFDQYPHAQATGLNNDWRKWYSDDTKALAEKAFRDELRVLGYGFEP